jgi:hypothetical protein
VISSFGNQEVSATFRFALIIVTLQQSGFAVRPEDFVFPNFGFD